MKKFIITISREFGCNAREIARTTAAELGMNFFDNDLIKLAAERAGISIDSFTDSENIVDKHAESLLRTFGFGLSTQFYSDKAIAAQVGVIRDLANHNLPAVFFGRCSDYILREYPNHLNIFLYAPLAERKKHMAKAYNLSEAESEKLIKRVDRQRHNYYKYVTGKNRGSRENKNLMIDVSEFGTEKSVQLICNAAKLIFGEE